MIPAAPHDSSFAEALAPDELLDGVSPVVDDNSPQDLFFDAAVETSKLPAPDAAFKLHLVGDEAEEVDESTHDVFFDAALIGADEDKDAAAVDHNPHDVDFDFAMGDQPSEKHKDVPLHDVDFDFAMPSNVLPLEVHKENPPHDVHFEFAVESEVDVQEEVEEEHPPHDVNFSFAVENEVDVEDPVDEEIEEERVPSPTHDVHFDAAMADHHAVVGETNEDAPAHDVHFEMTMADAAGAARADAVGDAPPMSEAARDYYEKRGAAAAPDIGIRKESLQRRDWQLDFGPAWGPAGEQTTISVTPQCLFRGEKIIATDTSDNPGYGTRILSVVIGQKLQRPGDNGGRGVLTAMFGPNAVANGIRFDTAERWGRVSVVVSFVKTCTFELSVFGAAVVAE